MSKNPPPLDPPRPLNAPDSNLPRSPDRKLDRPDRNPSLEPKLDDGRFVVVTREPPKLKSSSP